MWFEGMEYIDQYNKEAESNMGNTKELNIKLEKIADVQKFVVVASRYKDLELRSGRYIVCASSLMGVLSLDLENPIKLCYFDENNIQAIEKDFEQWVVDE